MEAPAAEAPNSAESSESKLIKIKVKTLGQASYDLEVESAALIQDVKSQLARVSNTPANRQRLVFRGRVLKDDQLLSSYNVVEGSVIHMVTRPVDTSQQPPPPGPQGHMSAGGLGQFAVPIMGGPGFPMDPNEFGSFLASMLNQMGIQGAVHVTHTTVPSTTTGDATPEQMAQAVAEQISQQARQQMSEAGAGAPVPLLTALRNYLQRLDAMSHGDLSVRVFNLPPTGQTAGSNAVFNLQQFAAAAREFIGEWGGGDEVRDFIASSAEPGFGHWQADAEAGTQTSQETTTTAAPEQRGQNGSATEAGQGPEQAAATAQPAPTSEAGEEGAAGQADEPTAERDPRRNGMDNPFGDGNPMHPSLALLTEIAVQQLLRETSTHVQAQLSSILRSATISQNIVDLQGPSQQDRLFSEEDLEGIARALHAEGTLLLETARGVSAYLLARRSNSATPLLNATAYHLRPDGSAPANTVPAALAGRRITQERRNAIFVNGVPFVNGIPAGAGPAPGGPAGRGQAGGRGGRPPGGRFAVRRGGRNARPGGGGRGPASEAAAGMEHAQQMPAFAIPLGVHVQALQDMINGSMPVNVGGRLVRVHQERTDQGNTVSVQIDNAEPVTLDIAPLVQAFERVFSGVPGIEQLFGQPAPSPAAAPAPPSSSAPQRTTDERGDGPPAAGANSTPDANPSPAATPETSAQRGTAVNLSAMLPTFMQQVIPIFVDMMGRFGGQNAPADAATGAPPSQQQGGAPGAQQFPIPGLNMGPENQVTVDFQTMLQGSGAEALGTFLEGIMFSLNEAGFQAGGADAFAHHGPPQDPRRHPRQGATRSHPVVSDNEEDDDDLDEEDEDIPALMQSSEDDISHGSDEDASHLSSGSDLSDDDDDEGDDEDDDEDDESEEGSDMPPLVGDRDLFDEVDNQSAGWVTAEEDSADEAERRGGSLQGRRVRSRRDIPSPDKHAAAHGKATDKATQDQKDEGPSSSNAASKPPSAAAAAGSIPVPTPATRDGLQSWPLSADNLDDSPASPAESPSPPAVAGLPPMPARASRPPVGLGAGLALPRGGRGGRRGGRSVRFGAAGRGASVPPQTGSAAAGNGVTQVADPRVPQASVAPATSSVPPPADNTPPTGVEEIRRQAGSGTGGPPDLEGILGRLLGGQGMPGGSAAARSEPGPGRGGGLMDILQSPAMQQMTGQLFGPPPAGARGSAAPVSGGPPAGSGGPGGGLMGIMSQLAQSPALQQVTEQLSRQVDEAGSSQHAFRRSRLDEDEPPPDFGAFLQQMLPVMGQILGGPPGSGVGGGPGSRPDAHATESGDEFAPLNVLPPAQASRWRQIIMEDRVAQAEQVATPLSSAYLAGSRGARSAE